MSHLDPDIAALIALGEEIADEQERAHLAACETCAAEVASLRRAITAGRSVGSREPLLTPPARVWDAISAELGFDAEPVESGSTPDVATRTAHDTTGHAADDHASDSAASRADDLPRSAPRIEHATSSSAPTRSAGATGSDAPSTRASAHRVPRRAGARRRSLVYSLVAAAAVIAVVAGTWVAASLVRPQVSIVAAAVLDGFPDHPGAEGEAVLEEADGHTRVVVSLDADLAQDGYREVWLLASDGSGLVSLGVLDGREGTFTVPADVDLDLFSLVDISQEEPDGDPGHSGDSIVRGELRPA